MPGLEKEYDVIVIGGGISGLACAAYLQKAGQKVVVLERREEVGTHCATEEVTVPGARMNLHATFLITHCGPALGDLELERFGFYQVTSSEWGYLQPFQDGSAFVQHMSDARKDYEMWKRLSPKDAERFRAIVNYLGPKWGDLFHLTFGTTATPESLGRVGEIISGVPGMPRDWANMDGFEVVDALFEDERIKAALITISHEAGLKPRHRGVGALAPLFGLGGAKMRWTARGGSHALPHALARCFVHHGGTLLQGCPVARIDIDGGEAKGVFLSKHAIFPEAEIRARKAVVSNLTCRPTFIDLIGKDKLSPEVATAAENFDYDGQIVIGAYYVLNEMPQWTAAKRFPEVARAFGFNFGAESPRDLVKMYQDIEAGRLPDPPMCVGGCSQGLAVADPTQAPRGQYTFHAWCDAPYDLKELGGPEKWDEIREQYGDKIDARLAEYAPNFKKAKLERYLMTPLDVYRRNPSAIHGCYDGGSVTPEQFWDARPFRGCGAPRTPFGKLYLSNSIWPWGLTVLPGAVTAGVVAEDLNVRQQEWWNHKSLDNYPRMCARNGFDLHPTVD